MTIVFVTMAVLAVVLLHTPNNATPNTLSMEDILSGTLSPTKYHPVWLPDGDFLYLDEGIIKHYNSFFSTSTDFINCSTLVVNGTYLYGKDVSDFYPSADETYVLFPVNIQKQFRSSFYAQWILYNSRANTSRYILNGAMAANPTWNPHPDAADSLAIVVDNNIMIIENLDVVETHVNVTVDGSPLVYNGIMDWLYEEEVFESSPAIYWSPDGSQLAYLKLNDTLVGEVPYPWFVMPEVSPYPSFKTVRYPKAGTTNPRASAHVYTLATGATSTMQLLPDTEYITCLSWIPTPGRIGQIAVRVLPRLQQVETLLINNATSGLTLNRFVTQNMTGGWVETRPYSYIWIDDRRIIDIRQSGDYYHVAMMNIEEDAVYFLTSGNWTVTEIVGYEPIQSLVYYISTQKSSTERHLYTVPLHGAPTLLTTNSTKTHRVYWGPGSIYLLEGSSSTIPHRQWVVSKSDFSFAHQMVANDWLTELLQSYNMPTKTFTSVPGAYGENLNTYLIHPHGAITGILYPVIFTYYNGPTSNRVLNQWELGFNEWISTRSKMIVVCIDGAGTGGKSVSFNQQVYLRLGVKETHDQLAGITYLLSKRRDMDWNRIGTWGWSYGGFMAINLALNGHGMFNGAVSVAPVTDWRLYDTFYTERYMQTPATNAAGYNETSMLNLADQNAERYLAIQTQNRTNLMIVHGLADDNVHFQNAALMETKLIENDIIFSTLFYPNQAHAINRDGALLQLYHQLRVFFKQNVIDFLYYDLHPDS